MPEISSEGTAETGSASPSSELSKGWKERIIIPTLLAGIVGGGVGLVSKHRKALGVGTIAASYASNLAIITGGYCSAREIARDARASEPDDLMNSVLGGIASGALLGRLQGGQLGAIKYAMFFAAAGTALDFATIQLRPYFRSFKNTLSSIKDDTSSWSLPEWSPIQVLDDEAVAAKRAREEKLYAERFGKLSKEES
ncbi:hypothetical protein Cni_G21596 [Canna indica]|uniref:Mitochondrial inner membrane translocase subunit Tim17/Tim22/Tim23/peroxisomal protein PMP24 n=1 Tax=Canna indica TaxID=4628 RepID=A0AAQ3KPT4_9LILI|nr:hypothetical protein Cni_G21596 [Canna indica]